MLLVVGPSGSGKSTLARGIAGLLAGGLDNGTPAGTWAGSLRVGDADVTRGPAPDEPSLTPTRLGAGIVFQDPASQLVMEHVADDVAFGLESLAWPLEAMRQRVPEALASVRLAGFEDRRSTRLSGGEQQRVAIAGVLAPGPGVLVLDEPTAHLDATGAEAVFAVLRSLRERRGSTIVLIEHRVALAWPLADLVLALGDDGRPIDVGPPAEVLSRSGAALEAAGIWLPEAHSTARAGDRATGERTVGDPAAAAADRGLDGIDPARALGTLAVLTMTGVRFGFDRAAPVLRDVDLEIRPGDRVALVGPNGSGKSTLLRLAVGVLRPLLGRIRLGERDPSRMPAVHLARLAGYVVQEPELAFLGESVREEVTIGLTAEQVPYAVELCERLRLPLEAFGERSPYRLSGGEQRRLSLVTGLARRPLLLALDEPTFGQDRRGHEALVAALDELVGEGSAILAATHDDRFVRDATDRRIELAEGWIVAEDAVPGSGAPGPAGTGVPDAVGAGREIRRSRAGTRRRMAR